MRTIKSRILAAAIFVAAIVIASWSYAQGTTAQLKQLQGVEPEVVSGADIGFRIQGHRNGKPVGTLVVRVNGEWQEVEFAPVMKLTGK